MSMYGMLFGTNPQADVILATLGLNKSTAGRFRDCFVSDGRIALYTRCGGGNRQCWHADDPKWGEPDCRHHIEQEEVDETRQVRSAASPHVSTYEKTGRRIMADRYVCEEPDSPACACYGCWITWRIVDHPCYITSRDDEFDSTYATVWFRFPEDYAAGLTALDSGAKWDPDARWLGMLDAIKRAVA